MRVTGNQLRAALKLWEMRLNVAVQQFETSIYAFPGEDKNPLTAMNMIEKAHAAIATIQTAQTQYNLLVELNWNGNTIPLTSGVKSLGMASHEAKLWRSALPKKDRYDSIRDKTRNAEEIIATVVIPLERMAQYAFDKQKSATELQSAIATANATLIEIQGFPAELLG
jgi:hypothetical protein